MKRVGRSLMNAVRFGLESRMSWLQAALGFALPFLAAACGSVDDASTERLRDTIVYGADDRREYFELDQAELRALFEESVVALVPNRALVSGRRSGLPIVGE